MTEWDTDTLKGDPQRRKELLLGVGGGGREEARRCYGFSGQAASRCVGRWR